MTIPHWRGRRGGIACCCLVCVTGVNHEEELFLYAEWEQLWQKARHEAFATSQQWVYKRENCHEATLVVRFKIRRRRKHFSVRVCLRVAGILTSVPQKHQIVHPILVPQVKNDVAYHYQWYICQPILSCRITTVCLDSVPGTSPLHNTAGRFRKTDG